MSGTARYDAHALGRVAVPASEAAVIEAELRSWALLAAGALAIAGLFAFLLALSRLPGIETVIRWPLDFFSKGLVVHVVFSLVVWFLAVFAFLVAFATREAARGPLRLAGLGRLGLGLVSMALGLLLVPAFHETTTATLNNYVPVIVHPGYYAGLVLLALGILAPVVRLVANLPRRLGAIGDLPFAMAMGSVVYAVALVCFAGALGNLWGAEPSSMMHEQLFWGGGHVLQFLYCLLMLTAWYLLARASLGADIVDPDIFRLATALIAVFALPALVFTFAFEPFAMKQMEAFRRLQFVLALPSLLVAFGGAVAVARARRKGPLPWGRPAFLALVLSPVVFGAGGVMGLLIAGADTRTPAHYHAVIAGVTIACMGLMLTCCLPALHRPVAAAARRVKIQLALFAGGQLTASLGLFLAGGYGAPRKTPSGLASIADGAVVGMYLHGIGALFAVIGGAWFVALALRALLLPDRGERVV